jgi:hypothetical protein
LSKGGTGGRSQRLGFKLICQGPNRGRVSISRRGVSWCWRRPRRMSRVASLLSSDVAVLKLMPSAIPSPVPRSTGVEPRATSQKYKSPQRLDQGVGVFFRLGLWRGVISRARECQASASDGRDRRTGWADQDGMFGMASGDYPLGRVNPRVLLPF